ncbi:MAG: ATP-binding cassette domain-containing protein [Alphaproteobacteria bacterium]|nr:ATP-binding cassette domain-containing protein [Alphaproteobacteria bacterium]
MAAPPLVTLREALVTFGGRPVFQDIAVGLGRGERVCLVGRNGGGKSTLLKALAGIVALDAGERFCQPGARIAYMPQEPVFAPGQNAGDFMARSLSAIAGEAPHHRVEAALDEAGIAPDRILAELSGGEARRVTLAAALGGDPDILLLDEPTNHLDIAAVEALEERLGAHTAGLLIISHDRAFLKRLSRRTLWLDRGRLREHDRGYEDFEAWSEAVLEIEAAERARADKRIESETLWLRQGISARRRRNQGRLRRLYYMRAERAQRQSLRLATLGTVEAKSGGRIVAELENVAKEFPGESEPKTILDGFSTRIVRGDRIGIIGANGVGKSTLLGIITGSQAPDSGVVRHGTNLEIAFFDQRRAILDPELTLWQTLAGGGDTVLVQGQQRHVTSYLKDFLFDDSQFRARVSTLSGGERNRLLLAQVLARPSNLLVLDEPTNDLDIETLDLLEEVLSDYDGTLLLVSHDRDFLDRLVTSVIAMEGDGVVDEYVGGYSDYLRQRSPRTTKPSPKPAARPAAPPLPSPVRGQRLSWKEKRELEDLPPRIAALEAEKSVLEKSLADPDMYARDRSSFEKASARLGVAVAELASAEERWLLLAERAEKAGTA